MKEIHIFKSLILNKLGWLWVFLHKRFAKKKYRKRKNEEKEKREKRSIHQFNKSGRLRYYTRVRAKRKEK